MSKHGTSTGPPLGLTFEVFAAIGEYRRVRYENPTGLSMSEATLKALAAECGLPVEYPDAFRTVDGKLLFPTPPMFAGLPVSVDDSLPFGTIQTRPVPVPVSLSERPNP